MALLSVLAGLDPSDLARPALITETFAWSFAELAARTAASARRLEARGIGPGSRVALIASPTPEVFLAIHALAALGAALVPIHPRLSPAEARVTVEIAAAAHVLGDPDLVLPPLDDEAAAPPSSLTAPPSSLTAPPSSLTARLLPDDLPFAIVSTSGTTGRPKGAVLSRRAFLASAAASEQNLGWHPDDRWLCCMPLAHVGGLSILTRCLLARRPVVMLPRFDAARALHAIIAHDVTLLSVVPAMLRALLDADDRGALRRPRAILLGGAAAPPTLLDECARRGVAALTTYGLTEMCSQVTSQPPRDPFTRLGGSGAPLSGADLCITDDHGAPLPAGRAGRILVRGPSLFDGYLREGGPIDPARSPLRPGYFDTGDLGELDDRGHLHVHARRTDLIITGGENVYPAEIEQALERFPGVRRALVFGVPDERWGQIVAAALEVDPSASPSLERLSEHVTAALASHKRPRRIALTSELPLTASGKVDRGAALSRFHHALAAFP